MNYINVYDADAHVAEIYDQFETGREDLDFLRNLIGNSGTLKILEPFCGTGRVLIPLALDGHIVHGMDQSGGMLGRARQKIQTLPLDAQGRIHLDRVEVSSREWPRDFDLVVLGRNCFYELATPDEQETCIVRAFQSVRSGGYLFIDNDHMEGGLAGSWQNLGVVEPSLSGRCADGTTVESTRETVWFDAYHRLARFRRCTKVRFPDGEVLEQEYIQQKHPVSKGEVQGWIDRQGFIVEALYGNYEGVPYTDAAPRAIFWARKP